MPISPGIFVPHLTPFDDQGRVDREQLAQYATWLADTELTGLFPCGSTGEFNRMTAAERQFVVEVVVGAVGDRVQVVPGVGDVNVEQTLAHCRHAADHGCPAVVVVAPYYLPSCDQSVAAYFETLADQSPIDLVLYQIPPLAANISSDVLQRLSSHRRIVGVKDTSGNMSDMLRNIGRIRPDRTDWLFLTGFDPLLATTRMMGGDGGMVASAGIVPEAMVAIDRLINDGKPQAALTVQTIVQKLFDEMLSYADFPDGFRCAARARGWDLGASRMPDMSVRDRTLDDMTDRLRPLIDDVLRTVADVGDTA